MRSPYNYLIKPEEGRTTSVKKVGDQELILNTELQNHQYVSRRGIILERPIVDEGILKEGDSIIVHHNVFRRFYDMKGNEKNSASYYKEGMYFCYNDQVFLYKRTGMDWKALEGYCFVKPLESTDEFSPDKEQSNVGVIRYLDNGLEAAGVSAGDVVGFTPGSEYEFIIDDERLYRVHAGSITIKYEREGSEKEYAPSWSEIS